MNSIQMYLIAQSIESYTIDSIVDIRSSVWQNLLGVAEFKHSYTAIIPTGDIWKRKFPNLNHGMMEQYSSIQNTWAL